MPPAARSIAPPKDAAAWQPADDAQPRIATVGGYFRLSSALGWLAAILLLIPAVPVIGFLIVLVRLTSPGPGIYKQTRVGLGGKPFVMYKIRTMRQDAEAWTGPIWASTADPRMTRLGYLLRRLHLDEFPQLLNVIRGEMALIGPRPERPEFTVTLSRDVPGYLNRLQIKPGITGLAQINLPPDTDLDSVRRKLILDKVYIKEMGPLLDAQILCCTALRLTGLSGDRCSRLTRLNRYIARLAPPKKHRGANLSRETVPQESEASELAAQRI